MNKPHEGALTRQFAARCAETRALLRKHMDERRLFERDGWQISESTRFRDGKTELVMRPIHMQLSAPDDLECVVTIDEPGSSIESECET
jgi:hypothetical protein